MLRTADPKFVHVGQLWQALYYVPQVRHRISQYRGPLPPEGVTEVDPPATGIGISYSIAPGTSLSFCSTEGLVWSVHELFGYMELSILAIVAGEPSIQQFQYRPWESISPREDVWSPFLREFLFRVR